MDRLKASAIFSALMVAMVLGEISPKMRIRKVSIPVAIPAPRLVLFSSPICLQMEKAREVEIEDAERFTTLLHIRIQLSIFDGFSRSFKTLIAALFFSSAKARILSLFEVVSAVSADEKKADKSNRINMITMFSTIEFVASPGSKKNHSNQNIIKSMVLLYLKIQDLSN